MCICMCVCVCPAMHTCHPHLPPTTRCASLHLPPPYQTSRQDPSGSARCKVLVSTSAAEEGLDVPSCSWVVRYNAAATGIQLLQSRGRARLATAAAAFVSLLQEDTLDLRLHQKAREEERNMKEYCSGGGGGGGGGSGRREGQGGGGSEQSRPQGKKQRL